nr:hypothetical protein [Tanacetum cinerariifolium]
MPIAPAPPSKTSAPTPPDLQDPTPTPYSIPPQDQPLTPHDSPPQDQPTTPYESFMPLLTTLIETCATISQKVAKLEKDKYSQALVILQLKKRVKKLERKKKSKSLGLKRLRRVGTAQRNDEEIVAMDVESQGRLNQEDVSAAEPTIFNDKDTSSKNLSKLLESQVSDKTGLGFKSQVFNSQVFDCEDLSDHELDNTVPKNPENDRYKTGEGYHVVPPPYTRTFLPSKLYFVFNDDPNASEHLGLMPLLLKIGSLTLKMKLRLSYSFWLEQLKHVSLLLAIPGETTTEDIIRRDLHLDDADGVECLSNEEIFEELARMGYEKPPPKLTFYKAFFSAQWKFLIHTLVQCLSAKRTAWNEFSCSMASAKVFVNMRRVRKGFLGVKTPFFASMLVQPQPQAEEEEVEEQPTTTSESSMPPLTTLLKTCATLSQKVAKLQKDKHSQALEILQLKNRVKKLEKKKRSKSLWFKRPRKGQLKQKEVNAANKGFSAVEPTVFDDEEIAQKLHDEEVQKAAARDRQEKADIKRALELQRQYDDKEDNIDWSDVVEQESFKKLKAVEVSGSESTQEIPFNDPKETSKEDVQNITYWKIIRVGGITEAYQSFKDMLKGFYSEDLVTLWNLVKEKFSSAMPSVDKEKALWVELKRLFEPDVDDVLWKLQRYMHAPLTWKLYTDCGVHHVSSTRGHDIFMLIEKD